MSNAENLGPESGTNPDHPETDKIIEPGLHKAVKLSVEAGKAIVGFVVSAGGVLITGEIESQFRNDPHERH